MRRNDRELKEIGEIEDIINKADVCRLAFAHENMPYIVTMNFGYTGEPEKTLYFHCAPEGRKIDMILKNNYVCFQMDIDHVLKKGRLSCDCGMEFSSIVGYGRISILGDRDEKIKGLNCIMDHYSGKTEHIFKREIVDKTAVLRLEITEISGKKCIK